MLYEALEADDVLNHCGKRRTSPIYSMISPLNVNKSLAFITMFSHFNRRVQSPLLQTSFMWEREHSSNIIIIIIKT